jgi:carbon-monoxide dehydrogenase small subunit
MLRLRMSINGIDREIDVAPQTTLVETLRDTLMLTGTKEGCGVGECGTCMVLIDGRAVPSCLVLAVDVRERAVETIEGLASDGELSDVQATFVDAGALQCGFCTPGMIVTATGLVRENPGAGADEVRSALSGVLCRCGTYGRVVEAVVRLTTGRDT